VIARGEMRPRRAVCCVGVDQRVWWALIDYRRAGASLKEVSLGNGRSTDPSEPRLRAILLADVPAADLSSQSSPLDAAGVHAAPMSSQSRVL